MQAVFVMWRFWMGKRFSKQSIKYTLFLDLKRFLRYTVNKVKKKKEAFVMRKPW